MRDNSSIASRWHSSVYLCYGIILLSNQLALGPRHHQPVGMSKYVPLHDSVLVPSICTVETGCRGAPKTFDWPQVKSGGSSNWARNIKCFG